ncbi:hypothetical protein ACTWP6_29655 [Mycobacterium sp. 4D054]|uniref:hypothetical protein n=1 Tax=Mycobacterium sp. 4D054 TaxID=3457440 RepID=UPI003FD20A97
MSRIAASRGRRVYRRDARGRFAKTGTADDDTKTSTRVAKAVGLTAISLAGVAAVGTVVGTELHHRNTVKMRDGYRRAFEAEQQAADIDRRVEKFIEKHRKRQRIAAARAR